MFEPGEGRGENRAVFKGLSALKEKDGLVALSLIRLLDDKGERGPERGIDIRRRVARRKKKKKGAQPRHRLRPWLLLPPDGDRKLKSHYALSSLRLERARQKEGKKEKPSQPRSYIAVERHLIRGKKGPKSSISTCAVNEKRKGKGSTPLPPSRIQRRGKGKRDLPSLNSRTWGGRKKKKVR